FRSAARCFWSPIRSFPGSRSWLQASALATFSCGIPNAVAVSWFAWASVLFIAFVVLRASNHYGDPSHWTGQPAALFTVLSFLYPTNSPPSPAFLLMTPGPALIALAFLDRRNFSSSNPLIVFGRVPLFFFLFHLAVVHGSRCRPEHVARRPSSFPPAPATLSRRLS